MRKTDLMPPADGVAPSQRPTFRLPVGMRYHHLYFLLSGITVAQIESIAVKAGNEVIHRYSGLVRNRMNKFFGLADAGNAILQIPFDRLNLLARDFTESTALNTGVADPKSGDIIDSLTVELTLAAGSYTPAIQLYAERSPSVPGGPGDIQRVLPDTLTAPGAGERQFIITEGELNNSRNRFLDWVMFDTAAITELRLETDGVTQFRRTDAMNDFIQGNGRRVPDANAFILDTSEGGFGANVLPLGGIKDFRYIAQMSGAATFTRYNAYIGSLR